MELIVYLFVAVELVLLVGWSVYVLPTPGPLGPGALAVGLLPVGVIMGSVVLAVLLAWAMLHAVRFMWRKLKR